MALKVYVHSFRAMGTIFTLGMTGDEANPHWPWRRLLWARLQVARWERRFSRFLPDSELSQLNRSTAPRRVSPNLAALLKLGCRANKLSGGLFSVAILPSLEAIGYAGPWHGSGPAGYRTGGIPHRTLAVNPSMPRFLPGRRVEPGAGRIDLGGLAKGWVADQLVKRLGTIGGAFVDAGGDVALVGSPPGQSGWLVQVEGRPGHEPIATLRLGHAGIATSSVLRRSWQTATDYVHHIIDPRTGLPAETDLLTATVVAKRAATAEWVAKTVLISGSDLGLGWAQAMGVASIGLRKDGTVVKNQAFRELERDGKT